MGSAVLFLGVLLLCPVAGAQPALDMYVVPVPLKSYRLLAMSMDDEGMIWIGATHRAIHRYDPQTGHLQSIPLPYNATASACLCAGEKVYVLGRSYPKLIIYEDSYYQIGYTYSGGGHFFAESNNIREPDGTLNVSRVGDVAFWQSLKPTTR